MISNILVLQKNFSKIVAIGLMIVGFGVFKQLSVSSQDSPDNELIDFNLVFRYGVGAKNELNTFDQTYTKDMIIDPPITVGMRLSNDELKGIYKKINDLELFNESVKPIEENGMVGMVTPCSGYHLKVQVNSEQKELSWDDCHGRVNDKFHQFIDYVIQIIESKEEYKKLPERRGGYI